MFYPDHLPRVSVIPARYGVFMFLNLLTISTENEVFLMLLEKANIVNYEKETNRKKRKQPHLFITLDKTVKQMERNKCLSIVHRAV